MAAIEAVLGFGLACLAYVVALHSGSLYAYLALAAGFLLLSDALDFMRRGTSLLRAHPERALILGAAGALAVALWDGYAAALGGRQYLGSEAIPDRLQTYLVWGISLPGVYASYQVALNLGIRRNENRSEANPSHLLRAPWQSWGYPLIGKEALLRGWPAPLVLGLALATLPWWGQATFDAQPGWLIAAGAIGLGLILEGLGAWRGRRGLLAQWLQGRWWPLFAVLLAAALSALAWEPLNHLTGLWGYREGIAGSPIPWAVLASHVGWYALFASWHEAIFGETFSPSYRFVRKKRATRTSRSSA